MSNLVNKTPAPPRDVTPKASLGGRKCQCGDCDRFFAGVRAFDKHQVPTVGHDQGTIRCMRTDEMIAAGMERNKHGVWLEGISKQEARARAQARIPKRRAPK